jgi:glutamate---cysteine ligase / carboxylate-amine ligase
MNESLEFHASEALTLGVELELQLVDHRDGDLTRAASDLVKITEQRFPQLDIKLEITESMIEIATGIQRDHAGVLRDLRGLRDAVCESAKLLNVGVCGGGAHPFQSWTERHIVAAPRMNHIFDLYGYLAKQFTVFGQHVHVGCPDGDAAIRLVHGLSRYIPHFIALAASSPLLRGIDTAFDCSRMNTIAAFPRQRGASRDIRVSQHEEPALVPASSRGCARSCAAIRYRQDRRRRARQFA